MFTLTLYANEAKRLCRRRKEEEKQLIICDRDFKEKKIVLEFINDMFVCFLNHAHEKIDVSGSCSFGGRNSLATVYVEDIY